MGPTLISVIISFVSLIQIWSWEAKSLDPGSSYTYLPLCEKELALDSSELFKGEGGGGGIHPPPSPVAHSIEKGCG